MGCFSWMYADTDNKKPLRIGKRAYVICPDNTVIEEECYDGYGVFGGHDIYDLVSDWNKDSISEKNIRKPQRKLYSDGEEGERFFQNAMRWYEKDCQMLTDFVNCKSDEYMISQYGEYWKREIGINIACYDDQNAALKYPIKICKRPAAYESLPPSNGDPDQGCGGDYWGQGWRK